MKKMTKGFQACLALVLCVMMLATTAFAGPNTFGGVSGDGKY